MKVPHNCRGIRQQLKDRAMELRELTSADLASLHELYIQLDPVNEHNSIETSMEIWKRIEADENIHYIGAFEDGRLLSSCYCVIIPNISCRGKSICFIENVVTDSAHRGRGLGKAVMRRAIEIAKENDCYKAILQSGMQRKEAHDFYRNLGFDDTTKQAFDLRLLKK